MRINKFVAQATGMSRRNADTAIADGRVVINNAPAEAGSQVTPQDTVLVDGKTIAIQEHVTLILNKPVDYVVSRNGQGSATVYDLLPTDLQHLKPVGRLDKDSSGLLLMTTDGDLANELTHPRRQKTKVYQITLDQALQPLHRQLIADRGITLEDGLSQLGLERQIDGDETRWIVTMHEGRNRQIRRTFAALGYTVLELHRTQFGGYALDLLESGNYRVVGTNST
jgi:23S rRNA pseudouridine2605 synthase